MQNRMTFSRLILSLLAFQTILFFYVFFQQKSRLAQPQPPRPVATYTCQQINESLRQSTFERASKNLSAVKCVGPQCPESSVLWSRAEASTNASAINSVDSSTKSSATSPTNSTANWRIIAIDGAGVKAERHGAIPEIKVHIEPTQRPVSLYLSNKKSVVWNIVNPAHAPIERVILLSDAPSWLTGLKEGSSFEWLGTRQGCRQAWAAEDELNPEAEFDFMMSAFATYTGARRAQFMGTRFGDSFFVKNEILVDSSRETQQGLLNMARRPTSSSDSASASASSSESLSRRYFEWNGRVSLTLKQYVQEVVTFQYGLKEYKMNYFAPGVSIQPALPAVERALTELNDPHRLFDLDDMLLAADRDGLHVFDSRSLHFIQAVSWTGFKVKDIQTASAAKTESSEGEVTLFVARVNQLSEIAIPFSKLKGALANHQVLNEVDLKWTQHVTEPKLRAYPEHWPMKYESLEGKRGLRIFKPQNLKGEFVLLSGATDLSASSAQK